MKFSVPIYILKQRAKALSRRHQIPLHQALDRIARQEGFRTWSLLAARSASARPGQDLLASLEPGDLVLIASRPRHGKTLLSLDLAIAAMTADRGAAFFTLDFTWADVRERFDSLGVNPDRFADRFTFDDSDLISADYIMRRLDNATDDTVVIIDYLQLLDQRRENPPLAEQIQALKAFASERRLTVLCLSQIDRRFDPETRGFPELQDVRLPNPLDLRLFDKACFLSNGETVVSHVA